MKTCYLTGQEIRVGDVVLRAKQSDFEKHVVVKFTSQGMYLSREVRTESYYNHYWKSTTEYIVCTGSDDISLHNNKFYVRDDYPLVFLSKFVGDMKEFKKFAPKNLKDNI
tara:strand:+ start:492 stop:821 length:330 start_codon:yes stop_codon:yes gene_type:complete